ncbi:hypothetical protein KDA_64610 [Dictyobacter alpinus]|uniref:ChbG/HpnK family deacetylase n=1 Tax=Dictyobacter alpinus TaxID=2014873 RepID=A0A402BIA3_9CHLR|nr:ChbG/HpnK family deacetylase [Dictyobacter alpinus]GCE30977.1 hypothetical protein KDA_64610 [Dictyobacter alpinus]
MANQSGIRLITRGDDMGAFQAGNQAIISAYEYGILRNASIMMPAPHIQQAIALAKQVPDLCLGLHITLTSEWNSPRWGPIAAPEQVTSLLDQEGFFFRSSDDLFKNGVILDELLLEARAQLALARAWNLNIRYMDEHMGIGWLFSDSEDRRFSHALQLLAHQEGLIWHQDLALQPLYCNTAGDLQSLLQNISAGDYVLITHPAYDNEEMQQVTGGNSPDAGQMAQERDNDRQMLCDPGVLQIIQDRAIILRRYDEC